tara:strand:+ start:135 stop:296 length:162 start_codon:yes stop_codon:yes gene_type:complete
MEIPDQLLRSGYLVTILIPIITLRMAENSQCKFNTRLSSSTPVGLATIRTKQQ